MLVAQAESTMEAVAASTSESAEAAPLLVSQAEAAMEAAWAQAASGSFSPLRAEVTT